MSKVFKYSTGSQISLSVCVFRPSPEKKFNIKSLRKFQKSPAPVNSVTLMLVTDLGDEMYRWQVWDVGDIENFINITLSPTSLSPWIYSKYDHSLKPYPGHRGRGRGLLKFLIFSVLDIGKIWLVLSFYHMFARKHVLNDNLYRKSWFC